MRKPANSPKCLSGDARKICDVTLLVLSSNAITTLHGRRGALAQICLCQRFLQRLVHRIDPLLADLVSRDRFGDDVQQLVDVGLLLIAQRLRVFLKNAVGLLERRGVCHVCSRLRGQWFGGSRSAMRARAVPSLKRTEIVLSAASWFTLLMVLPAAELTIAKPRATVLSGPCPATSRRSDSDCAEAVVTAARARSATVAISAAAVCLARLASIVARSSTAGSKVSTDAPALATS